MRHMRRMRLPGTFLQVMGPLSDLIGRRNGLILCSLITLTGALLSTFAWCENALIAARIITGIGMGGEQLVVMGWGSRDL